MPKFLIQASYTSEGTEGLLREGASGRRAAVEQVVSGLGGKVEAMDIEEAARRQAAFRAPGAQGG